MPRMPGKILISMSQSMYPPYVLLARLSNHERLSQCDPTDRLELQCCSRRIEACWSLHSFSIRVVKAR